MTTNEALRKAIRTRLATGSLSPAGKVSSGKGTGKPCSICAMPISEGDIGHKVVGPTTVFAHWDCYSIWRQESEALARQHSVKTPTPLHIDRDDGDIHPPTEALGALLRGVGIAHGEIVTACQALTEQPHYVIPDVSLTPAVVRRFRL